MSPRVRAAAAGAAAAVVWGLQEPLDQQGRAVVVVEQPGDERQQDLDLLLCRAEMFLADHQLPADPVEFPLRVVLRFRCGLRGTRVEVEHERRFKMPEWWVCEAGQPLSEFLEDFPTVTREQAVAALEQAKEALLDRARPA